MDLTIHRVRLENDSGPVDVGISDGRIAAIQKGELPPGATAIQGQLALLSPAFIDPHFHLENALLDQVTNQSGALREAIRLYADIKRNMSRENIVDRATRVLRMAAAQGTLWMRNNVDIDQVAQLRLLDAICAVREKFAGVVDIQVVAFPQLGLARNAEAVDLMWQAMEHGATVVGGMPHGEADMDDAARHIEIAFDIARKHDADVDMHVDETDDPYWHTLELLADKTIETGYQGRVTAGHCCAMSRWNDALAQRVIEKVRRAEINICTNSPVNLLLQSRGDRQPVPRGIARVRELLEAGVNVTCGQDDMMNMFYPFGKMDMLEVADFVAHAAHLSSAEHMQAAFDMPRGRAARTLRLKDYGVYVGAAANLVLIPAESAADALARHPTRPYVIREGQVLVQNRVETTYGSPVLQ
ncbi:MAG: amidohydrolase family protein [Nitrososphaerales archaeon]